MFFKGTGAFFKGTDALSRETDAFSKETGVLSRGTVALSGEIGASSRGISAFFKKRRAAGKGRSGAVAALALCIVLAGGCGATGEEGGKPFSGATGEGSGESASREDGAFGQGTFQGGDASGQGTFQGGDTSGQGAAQGGNASGQGASQDGNASGEDSRYEEHMDISIAYWQIEDALENREEDAVLKALEEKFNITIVPQNITWDDYYNKLSLWAETGELPDLFVGAFRLGQEFPQWVREGVIHEIPSDLSDYPNLARYMDSPETEGCMIDDRLYCIFRQTYSEQAETVKDRTIAYRWDLAKEAGITREPETWQEFQEMILAIMEKDSEGKQIGGMTAKDFNMLIGPLFTYSMPLAASGGVSFYWVPQGERYVPAIFAGEEPGSAALPTWRLVREMYEKGVIEQDIFLVTTTQAEEKFLMGKSAAICFDGGIGNSKTYGNLIRHWKDIHGTEFLEDVRFLDLLPSVDGKTYYPIWDYAWSESYINGNVSDEKLERILALYDYLLSREGDLLSHYGIEGESYQVEADGSISMLTQEEPSGRYPSIGMLESLVSWNNGIQDTSGYPAFVPEAYREEDRKRVERARQCPIPEYDSAYSMTASRMEEPFTIDTNLIFQQIVLGTEPVEEVWQRIMEEYREAGLMEFIEEVNRRVAQER